MKNPIVELAPVTLPDFGMPTVEPQLPDAEYARRVAEARRRASEQGLDALVVFGDREHFANLAFLTGYDPRFEESLLVIAGDLPTLMVGNEGLGYTAVCRVPVRVVLYQPFSLLGQPRDRVRPLADLLREAGIQPGMRVGIAGWKYYDQRESAVPEQWSEAPSFIDDTLRDISGGRGQVVNATNIFMDPSDGLRSINTADQLAYFEYASCHSSQGLRNVFFGIQPGMSEYDAARLMAYNGIPLACHLMMTGGAMARLGLPSPSSRRLERGEPVTMALGLWGSLTARAGFLVADAGELPTASRDYVDWLVKPYFAAIVDWYQTLGIGVTGGELFAAIQRHLADPRFGVGLNPGHLIHLDEWVHTPIWSGSSIPLRSGMALQCDVIPATGGPYFTTNIEDTLALADESLRADLATRYPEMWARVQQRRTFMQDTLGILLKPEVLPFSNIPAYLPPFWLDPVRVMQMCR
jgi:hypothetical protein